MRFSLRAFLLVPFMFAAGWFSHSYRQLHIRERSRHELESHRETVAQALKKTPGRSYSIDESMMSIDSQEHQERIQRLQIRGLP